MTDTISIFQKLGQWFQQTGTGNEPWRFVAALAVLIIGRIVLEILFQSVKQRVQQIMRAFEAEGIEFAFPTTTTYLAHDDRRPLHVKFSGETQFEASGQPPTDFSER